MSNNKIVKNNKNFKVLFIYSNINASYSWSPAVQILSAVLKEKDYDVSLIHIHDEHGFPNDDNKIIEKTIEINPDIILISSTTFEYDDMERLIGKLKKQANIYSVLGGIHATVCPGDIIKSNFDAFCIGEGEKPLVELIKRLQNGDKYYDIPSMWFKEHEKIYRNPIDEFVRDLDVLPMWDWEIMDTKKLLEQRSGWLSIGFSRGCPFSCTFCINQVLKKIKGEVGYTRRRSVAKSIEEILYLVKNYDVKVFNFDDDLIILNKKWFKEFTEEYENKIFKPYGIRYKISARADMIHEDITQWLKTSGCQEVQIGVETGDDRLRNEILKKNVSKEVIIKATKFLKDANINTFYYIILGIPQESQETYKKTVELIAETKPYLVRPTFFTPIIGTPLYDYCIKYDLMKKDKKVINHFSESSLNFENLTDAELLKMRVFFPWYLNVELGIIEYKDWISKFDNDNYDEFLSKLDDIKKMDNDLSEKNKGIEHFSYFKKNMNYVVFNDPAKIN